MIRFLIGEDFDRKVDLFFLATASISIDVEIITNKISYGRIEYEGYILKQRPSNRWSIYYKEYENISFHGLFANYDLALIYLCDKVVNYDKKPVIFQFKEEWEAETGINLDWTPP